MIIGYNIGQEPSSPHIVSEEKLRLKLTLDKMSRRAYVFLTLLTAFALVALLCNGFSGFRITKVFSPSRICAGNAAIEIMAANRDLENALLTNADTYDLATGHLSNARTHTMGIITQGFQSSGLFSAHIPKEAADEAQVLITELDQMLARLAAVDGTSGLTKLSEPDQTAMRNALNSLLTRAQSTETILQGTIEFESSLFRTSEVLAALGIAFLALFAAVWFRRFDHVRTVQFDSSVVAESEVRQRESALKDRIKELNCLYRFSKILESDHLSLDRLLSEIVKVIPSGWKHDSDAGARLIVSERHYASANFKETPWMQVEPIKLNSQVVGALQVAYLARKPELDEGPFSIEERALLKALAEQVDSLLQKYQLQEQLKVSRKYEGIGALISGIAHDFNNILFAIMGNAEMALSKLTSEEQAYTKVKSIVQATNRARDLTKQLISCTKPAKDEPDSIPVNRVVDEVMKLVRASLPSTIKLDVKFYRPQTHVYAQFTEIHQIILNLCSNAGHAMRESGGTLRVAVEELQLRRSSFHPGGIINADEILAAHPQLRQGSYVRISVRDTGCGIPSHLLPRIYEPFFSTKPAEEGTGMGLFNVRDIVNRLNGVVTCQSWPGEGSLFQVYLPSAPPSAASEQLRDLAPRGSERILLVDDEQEIVSMLDAMLSELGYSVTTYTDSRKALQEFAANPGAFDLLLTDLTMPDMTGVKLIDHVCNIKPGLPVIMMSGNDGPPRDAAKADFTNYSYLKKPVAKLDMAKTIREVLNRQIKDKRPELYAV